MKSEVELLERHALRCRMNFILVAEGYEREPFWTMNHLTIDQQVHFGAQVFEMLQKRDDEKKTWTDNEVYRIMLEQYGIACPHPLPARVTFPSSFSRYYRSFECQVCNAWFVSIF